jgi:hypothetical protein
LTINSLEVSVMEPVTENVIVSPATALRMAARNDPAPLSAVEVTTPAWQAQANMSEEITATVFIWAK